MSSRPAAVAFLVDVDNTLLDNDRVTEDLRHYLDQTVGPEGRARYWAHFERLRVELRTRTTWARCSATGSSSPATRICSRCPRS